MMSAPATWPAVAPAGAAVPASNLVELVDTACRRSPELPVMTFEDGMTISRQAFRDGAEGFAAYLSQRLGPGDRVAIMLENRCEFMIAWIAAVANGAVLVSMNPSAGEFDAGHILRDSGAVIAIVGESGLPLIRSLAPSCSALEEVIAVEGPEPDGLEPYRIDGEHFDLSVTEVDPTAVTNIYYTSGTTGPPKGCMLGHDYWLRFTDLYLRLYGLGPDQRLLCCLQFFYGDPPWQLLASLQADTTLIVMRRFSVSRFWPVVRENHVTNLFGLASIPSLLLKAPPSEFDREHDVRFALQIGVPTNLHHELVERWGFPWVEGYGLTETGLVVSMPMAYADEMTGSGSIGLPCPEVEIDLVDDSGRTVAPGEPGEILIRAPGLMQGYLNRPDATAETLRDGWLHSGDLGRRDESGFLYFLGRKKDIIRRSGENVAATEVEQLLRSHPQVLEAAVIAVSDELRGEEVKAFIGLVEGVTPSDLSEAEIVEFCRGRLAPYKVPRYIEFRDEFPRTPSMRVKKSELVSEERATGPAGWDRNAELGW
jgi:crotonobetaine/carnitine-CoA ligase